MDGELAPEWCDALVAVLRTHTSTPERCWFCLWEGNGSFWSGAHGPGFPPDASAEEIDGYWAEARAQDVLLESTPRVEMPARRYFLFRGLVEAAGAFEAGGSFTSPNLWWPDDRAWIVITEIDGYSTYVGGSRAAIGDVLASPDLETIEVTLDTHMDPGLHPPRRGPMSTLDPESGSGEPGDA